MGESYGEGQKNEKGTQGLCSWISMKLHVGLVKDNTKEKSKTEMSLQLKLRTFLKF